MWSGLACIWWQPCPPNSALGVSLNLSLNLSAATRLLGKDLGYAGRARLHFPSFL